MTAPSRSHEHPLPEDLRDCNLYELLGIERTASRKTVERAYRKKALKLHPDKNRKTPSSGKAFQRLQKAYECLLDGPIRAAYDAYLKHQERLQLHTQQLSAKKRVFKERLEAKEKQWADSVSAAAAQRDDSSVPFETLKKSKPQFFSAESSLIDSYRKQNEALLERLNKLHTAAKQSMPSKVVSTENDAQQQSSSPDEPRLNGYCMPEKPKSEASADATKRQILLQFRKSSKSTNLEIGFSSSREASLRELFKSFGVQRVILDVNPPVGDQAIVELDSREHALQAMLYFNERKLTTPFRCKLVVKAKETSSSTSGKANKTFSPTLGKTKETPSPTVRPAPIIADLHNSSTSFSTLPNSTPLPASHRELNAASSHFDASSFVPSVFPSTKDEKITSEPLSKKAKQSLNMTSKVHVTDSKRQGGTRTTATVGDNIMDDADVFEASIMQRLNFLAEKQRQQRTMGSSE